MSGYKSQTILKEIVILLTAWELLMENMSTLFRPLEVVHIITIIKEHSLVLMAVVDANCEFIMCDFGINGRISEGGVIEYTNFYKKFTNGQLSLPAPAKANHSNTLLSFVYIGDEAFTLRADFLNPFSR